MLPQIQKHQQHLFIMSSLFYLSLISLVITPIHASSTSYNIKSSIASVTASSTKNTSNRRNIPSSSLSLRKKNEDNVILPISSTLLLSSSPKVEANEYDFILEDDDDDDELFENDMDDSTTLASLRTSYNNSMEDETEEEELEEEEEEEEEGDDEDNEEDLFVLQEAEDDDVEIEINENNKNGNKTYEYQIVDDIIHENEYDNYDNYDEYDDEQYENDTEEDDDNEIITEDRNNNGNNNWWKDPFARFESNSDNSSVENEINTEIGNDKEQESVVEDHVLDNEKDEEEENEEELILLDEDYDDDDDDDDEGNENYDDERGKKEIVEVVNSDKNDIDLFLEDEIKKNNDALFNIFQEEDEEDKDYDEDEKQYIEEYPEEEYEYEEEFLENEDDANTNEINMVEPNGSLHDIKSAEASSTSTKTKAKDIDVVQSRNKRKSQTTTTTTASSSSNVSTALPTLLLPKIGRSLIQSPFAVQLFAGFTVANFAFQRFLVLKKKADEKGDSENNLNQFSSQYNEDDEDVDFTDDESDHMIEDVGFGRPRPTKKYNPTSRKQKKKNEMMKNKDNDDDDTNNFIEEIQLNRDDIVSSKNNKNISKKGLGLWGRNRRRRHVEAYKDDKDESQISYTGDVGRKTIKATKEMEVEIERLKERSAVAEAACKRVEEEYDEIVERLRETQKQLMEVGRTNNFLKNQVRDNKNALERAVSAERQKTNAELARVRDQMIAVLERERRIMRTQLMKSSAQVRSMIANQVHNEYDDYDDIDNEEEY